MPGVTLIWMIAKALAPVLMVVVTAIPALSQEVRPESQQEALASCGLIGAGTEPLTPYGFGKATLVSLWFAKTGAERGSEMRKAAGETDNMFSFMTAMLRISKTATNDFYCAKKALRPFAVKAPNENIRTAAAFMMIVYDAHISINERMNEVVKKLDKADQGELMDKISTLQVERSQRWSDLVEPATIALMMMVDTNRTDDPNRTTRLVVTKLQKESLFKFLDDHFPEFKNGTPREKWSDPAKTAEMYFKIFEGRKCADE
jgi:hypothetical protein